MARSFYETLGVPRTATEKDIRNAYRKLARQYHPDVNPGDKNSETRFKEINAANDVLSDADKRKKYDKYGDRWEQADQYEEMERRQASGAFGGGGRGGGGPTYNFEGGGGDFGSIFDNLFRRERTGPRGRSASRRGQDVETPVEVSLEEAFRGTPRMVSLQTVENCVVCNGSGEVAGANCATCDGVGQVARTKRLEVRVPAGVKTGSRVRVAGEGRPGTGGGPNGDLFLVVTVQPHTKFERKGDDLNVEVTASYLEAVLGGEIEVPTVDGRLMLKLPPLTQNGRQMKLTGKGMPILGGTGRGDLYAKVRVQLPNALSDEERGLFEQLRAIRDRKQE